MINVLKTCVQAIYVKPFAIFKKGHRQCVDSKFSLIKVDLNASASP